MVAVTAVVAVVAVVAMAAVVHSMFTFVLLSNITRTSTHAHTHTRTHRAANISPSTVVHSFRRWCRIQCAIDDDDFSPISPTGSVHSVRLIGTKAGCEVVRLSLAVLDSVEDSIEDDALRPCNANTNGHTNERVEANARRPIIMRWYGYAG